MTTITENPLIVALQKSNLDEQKSLVLKEEFKIDFEFIEEWKQKSSVLIITDVSQKAEIEMAKKAYKFIKQKRIDIEKKRKSLKEESLKEGKAIDEIAKLLTSLVAPLEEDLEQKAKFVEIHEAKIKAERTAKRLERVSVYCLVPESFIADMTDDIFESFLLGKRIEFEEEAKAFAKAEKERKLKEEQDALHEKRKTQLAPYWHLMSAQERIEYYGSMTQFNFDGFLNNLEIKVIEHEKEQERLRKEAEKQRLENERLKAEAEQQAKENAEKLRKQQEEAKAEQDRLRAEAEQARLKAEAERNAELQRIREETEAQQKKQREEFEKQRQEERRLENERREAIEKAKANSISIDKEVLAKLEQKAIIYDALLRLGYITVEDIKNSQNGIHKRTN